MLLFRALNNKTVLRLWLGQLGSAIGDEIYKIAFVWIAVGMIGSNTGYLASIQLLAVLLFGILGGRWSDRWNPYKTMMGVDLFRAFITLTPVICFYFHRPSFHVLVLSSVLIAGLGAFFEPAIQTSLPLLCEDRQTLKGATGLMATTFRLARVMGPAVIGLLSGLVATIHFFSINALSFLFSAYSVFTIHKKFPAHSSKNIEKEPILSNFINSIRVLKKNKPLYDIVIAKTMTGGAWGLVYGLGIALLIHEVSPTDVKAFGFMMSAYGVGNVIAVLLVGNMQRKNPERMTYFGLLWLGLGFIGIAASRSFPLMLFFSAFTAIGGPLNDLPATDIIQNEIPMKDMAKVFRLKMTLDNLAALIFMLISPLLFQHFSIRTVIFWCGFLVVAYGVRGLTKKPIESVSIQP